MNWDAVKGTRYGKQSRWRPFLSYLSPLDRFRLWLGDRLAPDFLTHSDSYEFVVRHKLARLVRPGRLRGWRVVQDRLDVYREQEEAAYAKLQKEARK